MRDELTQAVKDGLDRLRDRAAALDGPADITETFSDSDDYPEFDVDPDVNYDRGLIEGAALALGVTSLELLDELDVK